MTRNKLNESDHNPDGVGGQRIQLYNQAAERGAPGNLWWISFASKQGNNGVLLTHDVEAGDLFKMMDRITKAGLNPGGDDVAVFAVTAEQLIASGDGWMLDQIDRLQSHTTMVTKGSPSIRV